MALREAQREQWHGWKISAQRSNQPKLSCVRQTQRGLADASRAFSSCRHGNCGSQFSIASPQSNPSCTPYSIFQRRPVLRRVGSRAQQRMSRRVRGTQRRPRSSCGARPSSWWLCTAGLQGCSKRLQRLDICHGGLHSGGGRWEQCQLSVCSRPAGGSAVMTLPGFVSAMLRQREHRIHSQEIKDAASGCKDLMRLWIGLGQASSAATGSQDAACSNRRTSDGGGRFACGPRGAAEHDPGAGAQLGAAQGRPHLGPKGAPKHARRLDQAAQQLCRRSRSSSGGRKCRVCG